MQTERVLLHQRRKNNARAQSAPFYRVFDSAAGSLEQITFLVALARGALRVRAPVVSDMRYVNDAVAGNQLNAAQDEIDVLSAFIADAQTSRTLDDIAADDAEMMRVIVSDRHLRTPIAFELRIESATRLIDFILIGVEHLRVGMRGN